MNDNVMSVFAERLAAVRNEKNIKQKDAAEALGLSQGLLSHYENGIRECGLDFLSRAADYYGVSVDYLLGLTDDKNENISENPLAAEEAINKKIMESDKKINGSVLPVLNRRLIFNGINVLYYMLSQIDSNELTAAVSDDILLSVYNGFRTAYLANPNHSEEFFEVKSEYYPKLLKAKEEAVLEVLRASKKANGEKISEEMLYEEFGSVLASINNIIKNCENKLKK